MKTITVPAYAKINLSLDVLGKREDGYHEVQMIMHQVELHDLVTVSWESASVSSIQLSCQGAALPVDGGNIAYRAAMEMLETYGAKKSGTIVIQIEKNIPVQAGLAGGSADAAAVMVALSQLWELPVCLTDLMGVGKKLGADVPFCIMGQVAAGAKTLRLSEEQWASTCGLAEGIGERLTPLPPLSMQVLLSKPAIGVSTAGVYQALRLDQITCRPNTAQLIEGLREHHLYKITSNMVNVLETVTLHQFPQVAEEKGILQAMGTARAVLMSGSGPTVFALFANGKKGKIAYTHMKKRNVETYLTRTLSVK